MGFCICGGASMMCTFGTVPSLLNILPTYRVLHTMPIATIMDNKPMVNIMPFGMCVAPNHPIPPVTVVPFAGVPTPARPCTPVTPAPWIPGSPTVLVGNYPALNSSSCLMCANGGQIRFTTFGQTTIMIP
ncbi:MAG: DUF4280 domain-containing protein [Ruminococcus sp.]|nr:DUF4280 domain-containing protein [Ruminococcus sp.]